MAEYLSPEVYIEEIPSGLKPIQGVGTSTAAFVGLAQKGPFGKAEPITNFSQFVKTFGQCRRRFLLRRRILISEGQLRYVCGPATTRPPARRPKSPPLWPPSAIPEHRRPIDVLRLTAESAGTWGNDRSVSLRTDPGGDRLMEMRYSGTWWGSSNLTWTPGHGYAVTRIKRSRPRRGGGTGGAASTLTLAQRSRRNASAR